MLPCYLVMVGRFACLFDSQGYTSGGSYLPQVQPSRAGFRLEAGRKVAPGPPRWGLGVGLTIPPGKTSLRYRNYDYERSIHVNHL